MSGIGSVAYLNACPLVEGLEGVAFDVPSALAARFAGGEFEAALLPVMDLLRAGRARAVDGVAIGCDGPVASVFVASDRAPWEWRTVRKDPASLTSNALLEVLLRERWHSDARLVDTHEAADGHLLIGDPALEYRFAHPASQIFDLGEEWKAHTGLPFVFALWRLSASARTDLSERLRAAKTRGLACIDRIADGDSARRDYLTTHIRYDLGEAGKRGIRLFAALARRHGLLDAEPVIEWV